MMLTDTPFLPDGVLRAAFLRMTPVAKQIQHTVGRWRQGSQEILGQPVHEEMYVPGGGFEPASKAPRRDRGGRPPGHLFQGMAPGVHRLSEDQPAKNEAMATTPYGGQAAQHPRHKTREVGEGHHHAPRHLQRGYEAKSE